MSLKQKAVMEVLYDKIMLMTSNMAAGARVASLGSGYCVIGVKSGRKSSRRREMRKSESEAAVSFLLRGF